MFDPTNYGYKRAILEPRIWVLFQPGDRGVVMQGSLLISDLVMQDGSSGS